MNRRDFFKIAAAAPVAAPFIAKAAAGSMLTDGATFGRAYSGISTLKMKVDTSNVDRAIAKLQGVYNSGRGMDFLSPREVMKLEDRDSDPSVIAQMQEHDLFDLHEIPRSYEDDRARPKHQGSIGPGGAESHPLELAPGRS